MYSKMVSHSFTRVVRRSSVGWIWIIGSCILYILLGKDLKGKVAISFVDEFGLHEAGIDGGGVFKEFLTRQVRD